MSKSKSTGGEMWWGVILMLLNKNGNWSVAGDDKTALPITLAK